MILQRFRAGIQFSVFPAKDIAKYSTIQVVNRNLYKDSFSIPYLYGPLDPRLVFLQFLMYIGNY